MSAPSPIRPDSSAQSQQVGMGTTIAQAEQTLNVLVNKLKNPKEDKNTLITLRTTITQLNEMKKKEGQAPLDVNKIISQLDSKFQTDWKTMDFILPKIQSE